MINDLQRVNPATITKQSKSNFLYSFFFLPREKRQAIYTLYAFCRQTDDIVDRLDEPVETRLRKLNWWERELKRCFTRNVSPYFTALRQVAEHFRIPLDYFLELIEGVRMDLHNFQYRTFEDLKLYCYRVASTVGLMSIQIFGFRDPLTRKYAEHLGIALQLTNILRDVKKDARMGRIYFPDTDLERFRVQAQDIFHSRYTGNFRQLMAFEAQRTRRYYQLATEALPPSDRKNMLVAEIMRAIYWALLEKMEQVQFNVFDERIRISNPAKLVITLRTVSRIKLLG